MKKLFSAVLLALSAISVKAELLPLNPAEMIIPNGIRAQWFTEGRGNSKIKVFHKNVIGFKAVYYEKAGHGEFILGRKGLNIDCTEFDKFILWFNHRGTTPAKFQLTVQTDSGEKKSLEISVTNNYYSSFTELAASLGDSKKLKSFSISITYEKAGRNSDESYICGIILRNSRQFADYMQYLERFSKLKWEGLLKPESFTPSYKPLYNLCFTNQQLAEFRKKYPDLYKGRSLPPAPEQMISDSMAGDTSRVHTYAKVLKAHGKHALMRQTGPVTAFAGLVAKNKQLLRMAARYALSVSAMDWLEHPTYGTVGYGVSSAFAPAAITESVALTLDMAGEMLTNKGRNYVLKALLLNGVGPITYSLWARSYAFKMNQGMVFLRGKMTAMLVFDKVWPRVKPDLLNCKNQMDECMNNNFKADGSYMESFGYMAYTISCAVLPYSMYANMNNVPLSKVLPQNLKKSGLFAEACASTSKNPKRIIMGYGQGHSWEYMRPTWAAFLAYGTPESFWVNLYKKVTEANKKPWRTYYFRGLLFNAMDAAVKDLKPVKRQNLIVLKNSGIVSSYRRNKNNDATKIAVIGDSCGMGKKHCDAGSFILEYARDIYAMDMAFYHGIYDEAQYHNMLVAIDKNGKLTNSLPYTDSSIYHNKAARNSMRPAATGNDKQFHATVNPSKSWKRQYIKKWLRSIDSDNPNELTITDEYKLGREAAGVAFIWNTFKKVTVDGQTVTISGEYGSKCTVTVPDGCKIELDKFNPGAKILAGMALAADHQCTRIIIKKPGKSGKKDKLVIKVNLAKPGKS